MEKTDEQKAYEQELLDNGVDIPEQGDPGKTEDPKDTEPEKKEEEKPKVDPKPEEEGEESEGKEDPQPAKKRSIYDEYKDKKVELKSEKELRIQAEKERDEALAKVQELAVNAKTPEEKAEAQDEIEAYANEYGLDPEGVRKMRDAFLKGIKPSELSDEDRQAIDSAKTIAKKNQEVAEKQQFEEEFKSATPTLKEFFPNLNEADTEMLKGKLDELAHSEKYHDKELDYILFKNKDSLSKLITPKKRGLESKGAQDHAVEVKGDFDPNADVSRMTPTQREAHWEQYNKIMEKSEGLATDSNGRKLLI